MDAVPCADSTISGKILSHSVGTTASFLLSCCHAAIWLAGGSSHCASTPETLINTVVCLDYSIVCYLRCSSCIAAHIAGCQGPCILLVTRTCCSARHPLPRRLYVISKLPKLKMLDYRKVKQKVRDCTISDTRGCTVAFCYRRWTGAGAAHGYSP